MFKDKIKENKTKEGMEDIETSTNLEEGIEFKVDKTKKFIERLTNIKGCMCLNTNGKVYYISEFSLVEESIKKIEEKIFFNRFKEVEVTVPEFISEIITINGSNVKTISFNFDEDGNNTNITYYTLENLIDNFERDRDRYIKTKESLNELGYIITK